MLLPIKWLRDYVEIDATTKEISDEVTLTGSHVESIRDRSENLKDIVVGKINKIEKHPDADKLVICQVDVKDEVLQIVTGAPNVFEGATVPVAISGSRIAKGVKIKKGKLRGVDSNGMLCSLAELGIDDSLIPKKYKDGIYIFPEGTEIGISAIEALGLTGEVIEFEITPNRPDCLSIIGMARECAATFNKKLNLPKIEVENEVDNIKDYFNDVEIETDKASRFYGKVLKNVEIKESPLWIQNYLMAAGIRPTNNIVDLTNFVMLEYGQALHSYDLDKLSTKKIVVRNAKDGEILKTLDGEDRGLNNEDIVITDGEKVIGLAGIMGGFDTEITDETKNVFLEGANFDADSIRKTSKRLQLRSEASARFEKGIDIELAKIAVDRVAQLAVEIGAATSVKGEIDNYKNPLKEKEVKLRVDRCNKLIGVKLTANEISEFLNRLEIENKISGNEIIAKIPSFRLDLEIEEDLIEEVARIYGFHNIVAKPLEGKLSVGGRSHIRNLEERLKKSLLSMGYSEFMTYSFVSPSNFDKINLDKDDSRRNVVKILNPLGEEYSIMRTTLISNMLEVLSKNENRGNENVAGFEFGNTFTPKENSLPKEELKLSMGFYDIGDFYFLKESIRRSLWQIGIDNIKFEKADENYLHPGRSANIYLDNKFIGSFGEIHPLVASNYGIRKKVYVAEIEFEKLLDYARANYLFKELPKYPSMKRDLAFVIDRDINASALEDEAKEYGTNLLEEFKVFDIYTGDGIDKDKKSIAFSMVFRAKDRTLTDDEINKIVDKVIASITNKYNATLRS